MTAPAGRRNIAIYVAVGLVVAIWIGWTIHIWSKNGSAAGIGVLISWPAVFAALALVSAPFVGAGMAVRRQRTAGEGAEVGEPQTPAAPGFVGGPPVPNAVSKKN